jgi:hypothetical protein
MATAVQVESLWNGLTDNSGQPLAAGKVYTYSAGTTTPVSLFTASDKSTSATNPLILDANGKAQVWADGRYKFVVKTSADVTLYTLDNLLYGFDDTTTLYGGVSTGSANAQTVSVPATVTSYANGQTVSFVAGFTNTGATTLRFNSLPTVNLVKGPTPASLVAGDLVAGQLYTATYHGGTFRLQTVLDKADNQIINTSAGTAAAPAICVNNDVNTGIFGPAADNWAVATNGSERLRVDSTGNIGIGTTTPAFPVEIQSTTANVITNRFSNDGNAPQLIFRKSRGAAVGTNTIVSSGDSLGGIYFQGATGTGYTDAAGILGESDGSPGATNDMPGRLRFFTTADASGTPTERMRIDSAGNVGIGVNNPSYKTDIQLSSNATDGLRVMNSNAGGAASTHIFLGNDQSGSASRIVVNSNANTGAYAGANSFNFYQGLNAPMSFWTAATERIRISTSGIATFGTTNTDPAGANVAGVAIYGGSDIGYTSISRASGLPVKVNRTTNDGNLIELAQDGVTEGAISVSGTTITYGAFSGSHWSQLSDNSRPEILRGTVLETIDELCEWEGEENERLAKVKVSDTVASKAVYGVFMDWDNDWSNTNDMRVTSLGAFICRLHADATPQMGDLLESNGDGTARVQADDVIRSSTIGKVTCSTKTHEYDDGTFCVPVVLMCG